MMRLAAFSVAASMALNPGQAFSGDYETRNQQETTRSMIVLQSSCGGNLSEQADAFECLRSSAWEMYDFAATTQNRIRNSGLPAGMVFPASHVIEHDCLDGMRALTQTQIEFNGMADIRDRIVGAMQNCEGALRDAEQLSEDVRGDFSSVFNYGTLNGLSAHIEWLAGINPELLDIQYQ